MKIIKISSLSCPSCIIMNKIINQLQNKYDVEIENLDYDFDDIEKYNVGKILPVFIFIKNEKEITRLIGEHKIEDFEKIINNQE
ncbi:MAG: thioredoxin family protein [Bacilli bacterium]|nr:thioredoxin family protein [Bacilli bacterium]